MKICFLDKTPFFYNSKDLFTSKIRGAESVLINLSKAFSELGHTVVVLNNCPKNEKINNINWFNINSYQQNQHFDVVISNNDTRLFNKVNSKKKILISHSLQTIEKFIRKKQAFNFFKHRPKVALLGDYHLANRSFFLRLFGNVILKYGVAEIFINTKLSKQINKNQAIFTSRPDRNMHLLLDIWKNYIYPKKKDAQLLVTPSNEVCLEKNINFRNLSSTSNLIFDVLESRIFLIPGHKGELYCLAAEEARELCVPIVTLGIGSLGERVDHGITGFVANNNRDFANYTLDLYNNDSIWNELRGNLIKLRNSNNWQSAASNFISSI